ncbi:APC family permease [Lysobacter sp. K5869]|uniref:APC family permease n=1 Tax=Lysobacter sp. K5869 TaxID=2820808 RepID=UPI001C062482|nr:APC family permease [Lysobacter sp. K5869]QWP77717.1 APC family permease [Lysobacter sp. K5869]
MRDTAEQRLKAGSVGGPQILALVFATTGPLIGLIGAMPVALTQGNGIGLAGCLLLAGLVYLVFAAGFAALTREVVDAGAFYACVARGVSRPAGLVAAALATTAYMALQLCCYGVIGFFIGQLSERAWGESLPWWFNALLVNAVVPFCAQRNLGFAARLLGVLSLAEVVLMAAFAVSVLWRGGGPEGLSAEPFAPSRVFSAGFGAAMVFAVAAFAGFETAAVYGEEARAPRRTVPRALFAAILAVAATLAGSAWMLIAAYGPGEIVAAAARDPGGLWFSAVSRFLSPDLGAATAGLLLTSLFASIVGLQNVVSRYLYALGRDGAIWPALAQMHPRQETPYIANLAQASVSILALAGLGSIENDPLRIALGSASALAVIALLGAQILVSLAVIGYFRGRGGGAWSTRIAPAASVAALSALLCTVLANLRALTGGSAAAVWAIAIALLALVAACVLRAWTMRRRDPAAYARLGGG